MERQEVALERLEWVGEKPKEIKSGLTITMFLQRAQIPSLVKNMSHLHCPRAQAGSQKLSHLWESQGGDSPGKMREQWVPGRILQTCHPRCADGKIKSQQGGSGVG